jgi:hypothetical protein
MIPRSLSASAVQTLEACFSRWYHESHLKADQPGSEAADLGSACHGALERYVVDGLWADHQNQYSTLIDYYVEEYEQRFTEPGRLDEGTQMLHKWWERQDWKNRMILSSEVKESFPVKANGVEVPFNYIWDRCDEVTTDNGAYIEVVDYKTISRPLAPGDLKNKVQARCYGLAAQMKYPQAERIWVTFDLLRFDPVGTVFTREDNVATYRYLQRVLRRVLEFDETTQAPLETLNSECHWCIRKGECLTLRDHGASGGVLGIKDIPTAAKRRYELECAKKGLDAAITELDDLLLAHATEEELFTFDADDLQVDVTSRKARALDSERAMQVIGPDLLAEYGSLGVTAMDKLLKDKRLTDAQRSELKGLVRTTYGEPRIRVSPKNPIDTE